MNASEPPWAVPTTWEWVHIGEVAEVIGGGTPRTSVARNFEGGDVPWITPADLSGYTEKYIERGGRNITEHGLRHSAARLLPTGTVLFSSRAPIGYVAIARNPLATNQGFKSFVLPAALDPEYVYYYLQRARELALGLASGTTFQEVSGRQAAKIPLSIAPLGEQRRIVEAIESYFTRLDDAVATLERVQRNLKRYRASVLKAAVEGRLVPTEAELARADGRDYEPASVLLERILVERRRRWEEGELVKMQAKGKTPEDDKWKARYTKPVEPDSDCLPELPEGWCWSTVDQLASVGTGATPKRSDSRYWSDGDVPWVTSAVVNEPLVRTPSEYVTQAALAETNLTLYPSGTLLIAMYGEGKTRGRATVLAIESTTNQALAALELPKASRQVRDWLLRFFEHNYLELRRSASGGVQPNLNLSIVRSIAVPLPPLREQDRVVAEIDSSLSIAEAAHEAVTSSVVKSARVRQSILKWAFEGRLVDQDPTDEPASRLLERIQVERESANGQPGRNPRRPRARSPKA